MRMFLYAAAVAAATLMPVGSFAQGTGKKMVFLRVPDSLKDTEVHIAKLLLERLKVNSSLQMRKGNTDDLVLRASFNPNEKQNLPKIVVLIDTRIVGRSKDKKPASQVISIASFADVKPKQDKAPALLEWANKWNSQTLPMRVYVSGDKIIAGRNLYNSTNAPLSENAITNAFTGVLRAWSPLLADLRKNELIEQ
jgi:hypothetical protein